MTTKEIGSKAGQLVYHCQMHWNGCSDCDHSIDSDLDAGYYVCELGEPCKWKVPIDNVMISDDEARRYYADLTDYCSMRQRMSTKEDPCEGCLFCNGEMNPCRIFYPLREGGRLE